VLDVSAEDAHDERCAHDDRWKAATRAIAQAK